MRGPAVVLPLFLLLASVQDATAEPIDAIFAVHDRADGPGCAVAVYRTGEPMLAKVYGLANLEHGVPITPRTAFDVGSISKQFTALAVLMLEAEGTLSLDDDVRRFVPGLPDVGAPLTLRDLLHHTSGLRGYPALEQLSGRRVETSEQLVELLARQRELNFPPGSRHEYSHSDYELLAVVIERALGEPFGEVLERTVLRPLGMKDSHVLDSRRLPLPRRATAYAPADSGWATLFPTSLLVGGTGLYTTLEDLERWDRNFYDARVGGRKLVDRLLERPQLASGEPIPYAGTYRTEGLRWSLLHLTADEDSLWEVFPGHRQRLDRLADGRYHAEGTFYTFRQAPEGGQLRLEVSWDSGAAIEIERLERIPDNQLWRPDPATLNAYAGLYYSPELDVAWELRDQEGGLVLRRRGAPDRVLTPVEPDLFTRMLGTWDRPLYVGIELGRNADGRVTHFTVSTPPGIDAIHDLRFERVAWSVEEESSERARALHERIVTIDSHSDFPLKACGATDLQVDVPKMRAGGLDAVFEIVFTAQRERTQDNREEARLRAGIDERNRASGPWDHEALRLDTREAGRPCGGSPATTRLLEVHRRRRGRDGSPWARSRFFGS